MAATNVNKFFSEKDLRQIVCEKLVPDSWNVQTSQVSYKILSEIFSFLDENSLSVNANVVPILSLLCNRDVSSVIKNTSNFQKKSEEFYF